MEPLFRAREQRIGGVVVGTSMLAVGFLPLFGGPGYEQSLASGLIVPAAAAITAGLELSRITGEFAPSPLAAVGRGVGTGLWLGAVAFGTALIHGARVGVCDLSGATVGFILTALAGAVLGGVWGACVAEVARKVRRGRVACVVLLGLGLPAASAFASVVRFYTSPMVFAFDPFVGYFSGVLYDTVIDAGSQLLTYRLGSVASLAFVALLASLLTRDARGRLRLSPRRRGSAWGARASLAVLSIGVSAAITADGPALGHWETSATIAQELGGARSGGRCDVVFPASVLPYESALLVKDCNEQLAAVEAQLGARGPERVRAFFFRDAGEKKRLMGAADTLIAKPWRKEVYVQLSSYPHPILGHELAHVVAGSFGRGPFRVATGPFGLVPNPGLIEGVAVAASPDDDELSNAEWAHAMLDLGTLPSIRTVFSLDFFGSASSKSYTIAGAFVRYVMDRYGKAVLRSWYRGDLPGGLASPRPGAPSLTGRTWAELDLDFRAYVAAIPLPPEAQSFARARFEHAAVFGRRCPHTVDALRRKADMCRDSHEVERAVAGYEEVLRRDPHEWGARYGLGIVNARYGDEAEGERVLRAMADDPEAPRTIRDRSAEALADDALLRGDIGNAIGEYRRLADHSLDEDFARTLEVKAIAARDPQGRKAVLALLLGAPGRPPDIVVASEREGEWEAESGNPLAAYLIGRNLVGRAWYAAAVPHLERALLAGHVGTPRIERAVIRQRAIAACALGDGDGVARMRALVLAPGSPFETSTGRRLAILRMLDRCSGAPPS